MPKLDMNIYGLDETSAASACAAKALGSPNSDMWSGKPIDQSAKSESSSDSSLKLDDASAEGTVKVKSIGGGNDSRARTEGQHGKQG